MEYSFCPKKSVGKKTFREIHREIGEGGAGIMVSEGKDEDEG